jgi:RNA polymerase sigma factor (sigma-70 family)
VRSIELQASVGRLTGEKEGELAELLRRAQSGDQEAYDRLLRELAVLARDYASRRASRLLGVEDFVQDVLVTVHRARQTYDSSRPIAPWFYAIVQSRFVDAWRRARRRAAHEVPLEDSTPERPLVPEERPGRSCSDEILGALDTLPPLQRRIIRWLKVDDLSVRQIALRLRMTEGAVKVAAHRGYTTLRRHFGMRSER